MKFTEYFLEENDFSFIDKVRAGEHPFSILALIRNVIEDSLSAKKETGVGQLKKNCSIDVVHSTDGAVIDLPIVVNKTFVATEDIHISSHGVFIGKGTMLESGAIIKGPLLIGSGCEIRQGAYLRGDTIIGSGCVVGHVTEVKGSIFMDGAVAGHFAYVGDSVIGRRVNLGAGTKLANLQFRTKTEIDTGEIKPISMLSESSVIHTGLAKLGAVVGDYSEIGCNTVTSPGVHIGAHCWIYPNTSLAKGFFGKGSVIKNRGGVTLDVKKRRPPY